MTDHPPARQTLGVKTALLAVLTCIAAALAALEIYAILDSIDAQPYNCNVEDSTKVSFLGVFGSIVVVIALATVAMGTWSIIKGRPSIGKVSGALVGALCSFVLWAFVTIAAFGC